MKEYQFNPARFSRWQVIILALLVLLFLAAMIPATQLPLYNDEIVYRFRWGRYFTDGHAMTTLTPLCASHFEVKSPWILLPVRYIDDFLYGDMTKAWIIRLIGIVDAALWLTMTALILPQLMEFKTSRLGVLSFLCVCLGMCFMPYIMVLNRPESIMMVGLSGFLLLPLWKRKMTGKRNTIALDIALAMGSTFFLIYLFANHHKSMLFLPMIILSAFYFLDRRWIKFVWLGAVAFIAAACYAWWHNFYACPEISVDAEHITSVGLAPDLLISNPIRFFSQAFASLLNAPHFLTGMQFTDLSSGFFLPVIRDTAAQMADLISFAVYAALAVFVLWHFSRAIIGSLRVIVQPRYAMCAATIFSIIIFSCINVAKSFYELQFLVPLLLIVFLLTLPRKPAKIPYTILGVLALIGFLFSQYLTLPLAYGQAFSNWQKFGLIDGLYFATGIYDSALERRKIVETANLCGIPNAPQSRHVVLDEVTYRGMENTYQPYHFRHMIEPLTENYYDVPYLAFLSKLDSAGVVATCYSLDRYPELLPYIHRNGDYCCIPNLNKKQAK